MKQIYNSFKTLIILLALLTIGVSNAWGGDCNYTVNDFVGSKNTEKNGNTYWAFGTRYYYDVPTFEFGNVINNYGISHVKLSLKFGGLHAVTEKFQLQYKVGSGSWTNIGSQVTASVISTNIDEDVSIAGASNQKVCFRLNRVEKAKFTDVQTLTLSDFEVRMAPTMSADPTFIDFGEVKYGNSKSEEVTAYYTLKASGNMTVACTGDFSATITGACNCSTSQQSKTITVTFTPTTAGNRTGKLTITNPDGTTKATVTLKGVGVRADQTLTMADGEVFATIDKNSPVILDLSTLCTQVGNGAVTYVLTTPYPKAMNGTSAKDSCVIDGSNFHAWVAGEYTLKAKAAKTNQYNAVTSELFTVIVKKNVTTFKGTASYNIMVDGSTAISNYEIKNTSYAIPLEGDSHDFYYTITHTLPANAITTGCVIDHASEVIGYNANTHTITAYNAGTAKITLTQKETDVFSGATKTFTVKTHKYNSVFSGVADLNTTVENSVTSDYVLTYTMPNTAYAGSNHTATVTPSEGENSSSLYYVLGHEITTTEQTNCPAGYKNVAITYAAGSKKATGRNQGVGIVSLYQKETYKYKSGSTSFKVYVDKNDNTIVCSWGAWTSNMNFDEKKSVTFKSDNKTTKIFVTPTSGEENATYSYAPANEITAYCNIGSATWDVSQSENYKYKAASTRVLTVNVNVLPSSCYVVNDESEHIFSTGITDGSGHYDDPIPVDGAVDKISFSARLSALGLGELTVQYSVDDADASSLEWRDIATPDIKMIYKDFGPYSFPNLNDSDRVTSIRFISKTGGTLWKYYKNIKITRKTWLKLTDEHKNEISSLTMPTNVILNSTRAKFYINYSTCDDEVKIAVSDSHFKVSTSKFASNNDNIGAPTPITVTYTSSTPGTHTGIITVYTKYEHKTIIVAGTTEKKTQTIDWQEGFIGDPLSLPVGLQTNEGYPAATASSGNFVTYVSGDSQIIQVSDDKRFFEIVGKGTTMLIAHADGNDDWKPADDTITISATDKKVQVIEWDQILTRGLNINDVDSLTARVAILNPKTQATTVSDERTALLEYSCPEGNGVISINDRHMTVLNYGETTITAYVPGNDDYEEASMTISVRVRKPSEGCETPNVLKYDNKITLFNDDLFSGGYNFTEWETPAIVSEILEFDESKGKPDKLSYQYSAEPYVLLNSFYFCRGTVKAQQRVNGRWYTIAGSVDNNGDKTGYDWREAKDLQLDENADAIRFMREAKGQGSHNFQGIVVTLKQYLRSEEEVINLGTIRAGEKYIGTIPVDYSDVKGDLMVSVVNSDPYFSITDVIELGCGEFGQYKLPFTFQPMEINADWSQQVTITDPKTSQTLTVTLKAVVTKGDQWIYWNPESEYTMPNGPELDAYATSKLDVQYEIIKGADIASIVNGELVLSDVGEITIKVTQPGNENFNPATPVEKTFTIIGRYLFLGTINEDWNVAGNWEIGLVPNINNDVVIANNVVIETEVEARSMSINDGIVTITPFGGMKIGEGGVSKATPENLILKADADPDSDTKGQTGYLRISPDYDGPMPQAKMELFSIAYFDMSSPDRNEIGRWQYVGYPMVEEVAARSVFSKNFLYDWNVTSGEWENNIRRCKLQPFQGYATSQYRNPDGWLISFTGSLVPNKDKSFELAYNEGEDYTCNVISNSYSAPIDVTQFDDEDFSNMQGAIYIFNTGSRADIKNLADAKSGSVYTPGQYITIAIGTASAAKKAFGDIPTAIAPMQGFCVHTTGEGATLKLDYNKLVWNADYKENPNAPLHISRKQKKADNQVNSLCVSLYGEEVADNLYILESDSYDASYENGYDAIKMESGEANVFSVVGTDHLAMNATSSMIGTQIGVRTGETTAYSFVFTHLRSESELALIDYETGEITEITEGQEYTFLAEPNSTITDRFQIIEWDGAYIPAITTDVENVENANKAHKFIKDNHLFILKNGVLYNATGALVR